MNDLPKNKQKLFDYVLNHVLKERKNYEKNPKPEDYFELSKRWAFENDNSEKNRFQVISKFYENPRNIKILDMAAGCGTFVYAGLKKGYNIYGVEPDQWKLALYKKKVETNNYPLYYLERIKEGVGELLPYKNNSFDLVDSWQTFEHVQDTSKCLEEIYRVLNPNGIAIIHAPSYFSFYEGHYKIFYFPWLKDTFAKLYLRLRGRPVIGLSTFHPIYSWQIKKQAKETGFKVINIKKQFILESHCKKLRNIKPICYFTYYLSRFINFVRFFYKKENSMHFKLIK